MLVYEKLMYFSLHLKATIKVCYICNLRILQHSRDGGTENTLLLAIEIIQTTRSTTHLRPQVTSRQGPYTNN